MEVCLSALRAWASGRGCELAGLLHPLEGVVPAGGPPGGSLGQREGPRGPGPGDGVRGEQQVPPSYILCLLFSGERFSLYLYLLRSTDHASELQDSGTGMEVYIRNEKCKHLKRSEE